MKKFKVRHNCLGYMPVEKWDMIEAESLQEAVVKASLTYKGVDMVESVAGTGCHWWRPYGFFHDRLNPRQGAYHRYFNGILYLVTGMPADEVLAS